MFYSIELRLSLGVLGFLSLNSIIRLQLEINRLLVTNEKMASCGRCYVYR